MNPLYNDWLFLFIRDWWPIITGLMMIIAMIYIKYTGELDK